MALADIPGYGSYIQRRQQNEQKPLQELQQASGVMGLLSKMQAQRQEQAFRKEMLALGENATPEALAGVAAKYGSPTDVLKTQQSSLDRKAQIEATKETAKARLEQMAESARGRLEQQAQNAQMIHEFRLSRAGTDTAKAEETARHNKAMEAIQAQNAGITQQFRKMGLDLQQQNIDLRRDIQSQKTEKIATEKEASVNNVIANMDRLAQEANRLLNHPGLPKTTGLRSWLPLAGGLATVPGTDAANFKAGLETLKSQAGFSVLQAMREASQTGGALGQVSDFENRMLQTNLGALDTAQSEDEFKTALQKIITYTEGAKERLKNAARTAPAPAQPAAPPAGALTPAEQAELEALRKRFGR